MKPIPKKPKVIIAAPFSPAFFTQRWSEFKRVCFFFVDSLSKTVGYGNVWGIISFFSAGISF
jgi:hypothetical protein